MISEWDEYIVNNTELNSNNPDYFYYMGMGAFYGVNCNRDDDKAREFYEQGAEQGSAKCKYALAIMEKQKTGCRLSLFVDAYDELLRQAEADDSEAQRMISCYYLSNDRGQQKDLGKAFEWLKKSANNQNILALFNLSHCYMCGEFVEKDVNKGMEFLERCADMGYKKAKKILNELKQI